MNTLIIAPHPDDELLGCGGTILKRISSNHNVGVILITSMTEEAGWSLNEINNKNIQFSSVCRRLDISDDSIFRFNFPANLDQVPFGQIVEKFSDAFNRFRPEEVFLPHPGDIHTDHQITFNAAASCTKWFRHPSIRKVLTYETLSETNFRINPLSTEFSPNIFVDISDFIEEKLSLLSIYNTELLNHPFPRSLASVKAQAYYEVPNGVNYAEAFHLLRSFE